MIEAHPALVAVSPQAPVGDWFIGDDFHHNGAPYLAHAFRWFSMNDRAGSDRTGVAAPPGFQYPTPDGYRMFLDLGTLPNIDETMLKGSVPFWSDFRQHPTYDSFWKERDVRQYLKNIRPAVLTWVAGSTRKICLEPCPRFALWKRASRAPSMGW